MKGPIYLDHAATTPVDPRVVSKMVPYLYERFGNAASSTHVYGWGADEAVEIAREEVAALLGCDPAELIWTSGATESNNLALKGVIGGVMGGVIDGASSTHGGRGGHVVSVRTEHASVLAPLRALQARGDIELTLLDVLPNGRIDPQVFAQALRPDTVLASVMWVNNETGVVQDIAALAAICGARGVLLHVDAAQAAGKVDIDLSAVPVDLLSVSAHKIHGPQGIGALFVRRELRDRLQAQQLGGAQEQGLRAGTLPLHQIVGFGEAYRMARRGMAVDNDRIRWLRDRLWSGLAQLDGVFLNGDAEHCIPHILNIGFTGIDALALIERLAPQLAMSSGAACASSKTAASTVLTALGRSEAQALASLRLSLGRFTRAEDIDIAIELIAAAVAALRAAKPAADDDEDCPMKRMRRRARQRTVSTTVKSA